MRMQSYNITTLHSTGLTELRFTQHKIGHFGEVLPSQSLGLVLKNYTKHNKDKTYICNKTHYNTKNYRKVWSPFMASGLEMEWAYSTRTSKQVMT